MRVGHVPFLGKSSLRRENNNTGAKGVSMLRLRTDNDVKVWRQCAEGVVEGEIPQVVRSLQKYIF